MIRAQRARQRAGWRAFSAVGIVALLVTACSTDREVTRPKPLTVTDERLASALLTASDLPSDYKAAAESTPAATQVVPEHKCDDALDDLEPKREVAADFSNGTNHLAITVAWYPGGGAAVERLYRDVGNRCSQVVVSDQGLSLRTSALDFGVLSDDTLPLQFEVEPEAGAIDERDLIVIRNGDLVTTIRLQGPRPSDKVLLDSTVRVSIGRLGRVALDTT